MAAGALRTKRWTLGDAHRIVSRSRTASSFRVTSRPADANEPPTLLYLLVGLSGAAGLCYELLWIRALGLHFGTSTPAITTVVATFMAGLGAGNWLLGRRADRSQRPFALYQRLEPGIAATGLLVSLFVLRGGHW